MSKTITVRLEVFEGDELGSLVSDNNGRAIVEALKKAGPWDNDECIIISGSMDYIVIYPDTEFDYA